MTLQELNVNVVAINHSKLSRANAVATVVDYPEVLPEIIEKAFKGDKDSHKFCWWLEFLNKQHLEMLCPYLDNILKNASLLTNDSAIRSIAKIIETYVLNYYSKKPNDVVKTMMIPTIKEKMVALSFEWLINNQLKVAPRAYSMTSLFYLGKEVSWVHNELLQVIEQNYAKERAAYQARARMILKKLK